MIFSFSNSLKVDCDTSFIMMRVAHIWYVVYSLVEICNTDTLTVIDYRCKTWWLGEQRHSCWMAGTRKKKKSKKPTEKSSSLLKLRKWQKQDYFWMFTHLCTIKYFFSPFLGLALLPFAKLMKKNSVKIVTLKNLWKKRSTNRHSGEKRSVKCAKTKKIKRIIKSARVPSVCVCNNTFVYLCACAFQGSVFIYFIRVRTYAKGFLSTHGESFHFLLHHMCECVCKRLCVCVRERHRVCEDTQLFLCQEFLQLNLPNWW